MTNNRVLLIVIEILKHNHRIKHNNFLIEISVVFVAWHFYNILGSKKMITNYKERR